MKQSWKWLIAVAVSAAAFVGIYFLYGALKVDYAPDPFAASATTAPQTDADPAPAETAAPADTETDAVDYSAPDFTVYDAQGNAVRLSDYFGKPIVLNFWASWCYYCRVEMPDFDAACRENPDVQFLMVNVTDNYQETLESAKRFIADSGYTFPVLYDTTLEAARTYGASGLPVTFFIDRNGDLVTYASGMLSAASLARGIALIQ